jgi:cytochrome P450
MTRASADVDDERYVREAAAFDPQHIPDGFYADPYPWYRALREREPVHRCPDGTLFLTRYRDLDAIYRDRSHFSSDKRVAFAPRFGTGTPLFEHHTTSLVFNDPPLHTRVRRQIVGALTPATLKRMEPGLLAMIERLLDAIADKGAFDGIDDYAAAIPVGVIGNLLRVPADEREPLRDWSLAILGALEPTLTPAQLERGQRSVTDFLEYMGRLVADRRRHLLGDDDVLSRLIREETGGEPLTPAELLHNCIFLLNAGHETTTNLIGNGLKLLLDHPAECARLRSSPSLAATAVEEVLRFESPNQFGNRLTVAPVTLPSGPIEAGSYLTLCIGAANRDPDEFPDADRFDISRSPNRHLAFAAGAHACAGMSVARLEGQLALTRMIARFPALRATGAAVRSSRARFRGFVSLPLGVE